MSDIKKLRGKTSRVYSKLQVYLRTILKYVPSEI